jgi:hypothetical protein
MPLTPACAAAYFKFRRRAVNIQKDCFFNGLPKTFHQWFSLCKGLPLNTPSFYGFFQFIQLRRL